MSVLHILASLTATTALVVTILEYRGQGRMPLLPFLKETIRRPRRPWLDALAGILAGLLCVAGSLLLLAPLGRLQVVRTGSLSASWTFLAIFSAALKLAWVFFEEVTFRGALLPWLGRRLGSVAGLLLSSVLFALAHSGRDPLALLVLFLDGLGFGAAFLLTGSLWLPLVWHASKNLAVWMLLGKGTLQFAAGLFRLQETTIAGKSQSPGATNLQDVAITAVVVLLVAGYLLSKARAGRTPAAPVG